MKENEQVIEIRALDTFVWTNGLAQFFESRRSGVNKDRIRRTEEEWVSEDLRNLEQCQHK